MKKVKPAAKKTRAPAMHSTPFVPASVVPPEFTHLVAAAVWMPAAELPRWVDNPRDNAPAVPRVKLCMATIGFIAPICIWTSKRRIVAGHTRLTSWEELVAESTAGGMAYGGAAAGLV